MFLLYYFIMILFFGIAIETAIFKEQFEGSKPTAPNVSSQRAGRVNIESKTPFEYGAKYLFINGIRKKRDGGHLEREKKLTICLDFFII